MTTKNLINYLSQFPSDTPVMLNIKASLDSKPIDLTDEYILETSDAAYIDVDAPEDEYDCEDGKIVYDGNRILVINPIIL